MIGGKMIGHRPISTSQHHPGAQRRQLRTGAIEAEQGQRGHGGRKPGKGMNLATSPQNECGNRRRRPSRGLAHTPGTPIFALFRWTSERAASIRCPDGGSGQGSFASFLKGPLPPSGDASVPAHAASVVVRAMRDTSSGSDMLNAEPALKPYQPNQRMKTPRDIRGRLWPPMTFEVPSSLKRPNRGPRSHAPTSAATPPTPCTVKEPAKSWKFSCESQPPPQIQWPTTG